jgi:hypothetical protein
MAPVGNLYSGRSGQHRGKDRNIRLLVCIHYSFVIFGGAAENVQALLKLLQVSVQHWCDVERQQLREHQPVEDSLSFDRN